MNDQTHIFVGHRRGWQDSLPFGISPADHRHHVYIIGKIGSGKTTLLRNMILQHIALGHGVGVIDPHGDLAEEILEFIPPSRADHLVYFNPGDLEFPVALNLLAKVPEMTGISLPRELSAPARASGMTPGGRVSNTNCTMRSRHSSTVPIFPSWA